MDENIFELLEEWDYALLYEDREREREAGKKILALREAWRKRQNIKNEEEDARKRQIIAGGVEE